MASAIGPTSATAPLGTARSAGSAGSGGRVPGTLYRGREGMWSWVAHRITGVAIFFFLLSHVLDTALVRVDPDAYNAVIATYKNPIVNALEVGLVGAVLFHALNGVRVILVDFWEKGTIYHRQMFWGLAGLWTVLMLGFLYPMTQHTVRHFFGEG